MRSIEPRSLLAGSMMHTDLPVSPAFFKVHIPSAIVFVRVIVCPSSAHLLKANLLGPFAEALPAEHNVVSPVRDPVYVRTSCTRLHRDQRSSSVLLPLAHLHLVLFFKERNSVLLFHALLGREFLLLHTPACNPDTSAFENDVYVHTEDTDLGIVGHSGEIRVFFNTERDVAALVELAFKDCLVREYQLPL